MSTNMAKETAAFLRMFTANSPGGGVKTNTETKSARQTKIAKHGDQH
jgi:hypothetical protein